MKHGVSKSPSHTVTEFQQHKRNDAFRMHVRLNRLRNFRLWLRSSLHPWLFGSSYKVECSAGARAPALSIQIIIALGPRHTTNTTSNVKLSSEDKVTLEERRQLHHYGSPKTRRQNTAAFNHMGKRKLLLYLGRS